MHRTYTIAASALVSLSSIAATACGNEASSVAEHAGTTITTSVEPSFETSTTTPATAPASPPASIAPARASTTTVNTARPTLPIDTLVPVGDTGARLHIRCVGAGPSTVVLISGFTDGGDSWGAVEPAVSDHARVCSYARFGTGSSDSPPTVQTFVTQAIDLAELLVTVGEPGPYVLVGHSFGGPEAVTFTARFPDEVRGVLLLDASPIDWPTAVGAVPQDGTEAAATYLGLCSTVSNPAQNAERLDAPAAFAEAGTITDIGVIPLIVATAAEHPRPGLDPSAAAELDQVWEDGQQHWTSLSSDAQMLTVENSGHYIQTDQPGLVVEQILNLVDATGS